MVSCLLVYLVPGPTSAHAQTLRQLLENRTDPAPSYRTLRTAHFEFHFPEGLEDLVQDVAETAERVHERLANALQWDSRDPTHVVLAHRSDQAGTFTDIHPVQLIFLDIALPHQGIGLNDFSDWHEWVLTHEYAHIVHHDIRGRGYRWLSHIFGSWARPSMSHPSWLKEGIGVAAESALTPRGRGGSSTYRMMMRMAVADGLLGSAAFGALDNISSDASAWPWTLRAYLFGHYLVRTLTGGDIERLARFQHEASSSLPYRLDPGVQALGGESVEAVWKEMLAEVRSEAEAELAELRKTPLTQLDYLTNTGYLYEGLTISPNGTWLIATRENPHDETEVVRFTLENDAVRGPDVLFPRSTGYQSSFSKSSRFIAFDEISRARRHYFVSDIFLYDLEKQSVVAASPWFRARDPDIHPDGKHLAFVVNELGKNRLLITDTDWEDAVDVLGDVGYRRITGPRFSPDGQRIALTLHNSQTGGEDLWVVEPDGPQELIADGAQVRSPCWTPNGRMLIFSSDRTGVFNLYALELEPRRLYQMTHVLGGLFYPVVDPSMGWVYAVSYRGQGDDIARFRWDPTTWVEVALPQPAKPEPGLSPEAGMGSLPQPPAATGAVPSVTTAEAYSSFQYLAPRYLFPSVALRPGSLQLGFSFGAVDPLYLQLYHIDVRLDFASNVPVGRLFYWNSVLPWAMDLTLTHDVAAVTATGTQMSTAAGTLAVNVPLSEHNPLDVLRPGVVVQRSVLFGSSFVIGPQAGIRHDSEFRQLGHSFPESGNFAELYVRQLFRNDGSSSTLFQGSVRKHWPLWVRRHALHLGLEGGTYLPGEAHPNAVLVAGGAASFPQSWESPVLMFGFPPYSLLSRTLAVGTSHYTLELASIERGLVVLPIFLGRLSVGVRLQAATLGDFTLERIPWSGGVELYQELVAGHLFGLRAQLGAYRGIGSLGELQVVFSLASSE